MRQGRLSPLGVYIFFECMGLILDIRKGRKHGLEMVTGSSAVCLDQQGAQEGRAAPRAAAQPPGGSSCCLDEKIKQTNTHKHKHT